MIANVLFFISQYFYVACIIVFIVGAVLGSFLNVVIYRYPVMLLHEYEKAEKSTPFNLFFPRSHCPHCKAIIPFYFNIPLIGFIALRGKCRNCHHGIALHYFVVEIMSALTTLFVFLHFSISLQAVELLVFTYGLIVLSVIDIHHHFLPDTIIFLLLWLGMIVSTQHIFTDPTQAIFGVIVGYLFFWIIAKLYYLLRKQEGLGMGDCKMLAMIGAWVGVASLLNVILIATTFALTMSIMLLLIKKIDVSKKIPFGPFLAIAGWVTVFYGSVMTSEMTQWLS